MGKHQCYVNSIKRGKVGVSRPPQSHGGVHRQTAQSVFPPPNLKRSFAAFAASQSASDSASGVWLACVVTSYFHTFLSAFETQVVQNGL